MTLTLLMLVVHCSTATTSTPLTEPHHTVEKATYTQHVWTNRRAMCVECNHVGCICSENSSGGKICCNSYELNRMLNTLLESDFISRIVGSIRHEVSLYVSDTLRAWECARAYKQMILVSDPRHPMIESILLEELIHLRQYSDPDWRSYALNIEIEAKVGWVLYQASKNWGYIYTDRGADIELKRLARSYLLSNRRDYKRDPNYIRCYQEAIMALRDTSRYCGYTNERRYPENRHYREMQTLDRLNIKELFPIFKENYTSHRCD